MATIAYLRDHDLAVDAYVAHVGRKFAPGWAEMQERPLRDIAEMVALNMVSMGGTLQSLSGDEAQAQVVLLGWPSAEWRAVFAPDQADIAPIWGIFGPIAESLGFQFEFTRQADALILTFSR